MANTGEAPPVCKCHDEPQLWAVSPRYRAGGFWRCAVKQRQYQREYGQRAYAEMSNFTYNRLLLRQRRWKALRRIARRAA
jgi:hypothetical protein